MVWIGALAMAAIAAWALWPQNLDLPNLNRRFIIRWTLDRVDEPVLVLGDSIVEASTLPRTLCGHPVVNGGIGGLSTASALRIDLAGVLQTTQAALIVVSLGSNDAAQTRGAQSFDENYSRLLDELKPFASRLAVVQVPPLERGFAESERRNPRLIGAYNAALPNLARRSDAAFIALPEMPAGHTFDGLHLNRAGYAVWESAVADGIARVLCGGETALRR